MLNHHQSCYGLLEPLEGFSKLRLVTSGLRIGRTYSMASALGGVLNYADAHRECKIR